MSAFRLVLTIVSLLALPQLLSAQRAVVPPSIGLPLPPIGLPLPAISPAPAQELPTLDFGGPPRRRPHLRPPPAIVFYGAPYNWGFDEWQLSSEPGVVASPPPAEPPAEISGRIELNVEPSEAQVFVDGEYVGTAADLNGTLDLTPGTRRIEIRLQDHEPLTFDARIVAGRRITYRATLVPLADRTASPAATPTRRDTTFFYIPGCYLGNVPPDQVKLPVGCDLSKLVTHKP